MDDILYTLIMVTIFLCLIACLVILLVVIAALLTSGKINQEVRHMNTVLCPEDVANAIQSFVLVNEGDEAAVSLLLSIGAELLDISPEEMAEMIK
jgi:hypothetical protein